MSETFEYGVKPSWADNSITVRDNSITVRANPTPQEWEDQGRAILLGHLDQATAILREAEEWAVRLRSKHQEHPHEHIKDAMVALERARKMAGE